MYEGTTCPKALDRLHLPSVNRPLSPSAPSTVQDFTRGPHVQASITRPPRMFSQAKTPRVTYSHRALLIFAETLMPNDIYIFLVFNLASPDKPWNNQSIFPADVCEATGWWPSVSELNKGFHIFPCVDDIIPFEARLFFKSQRCTRSCPGWSKGYNRCGTIGFDFILNSQGKPPTPGQTSTGSRDGRSTAHAP
jgi:hypothetical protein